MYTREQYNEDRRKAIADGVDPRLIMSYSECLAWDAWQDEREKYVYDDDELLEFVEAAEESAVHEIREFGFPVGEFDERIVDDEELHAFWQFADDCGEYIPFELFA